MLLGDTFLNHTSINIYHADCQKKGQSNAYTHILQMTFKNQLETIFVLFEQCKIVLFQICQIPYIVVKSIKQKMVSHKRWDVSV